MSIVHKLLLSDQAVYKRRLLSFDFGLMQNSAAVRDRDKGLPSGRERTVEEIEPKITLPVAAHPGCRGTDEYKLIRPRGVITFPYLTGIDCVLVFFTQLVGKPL
jgi:hypothetical protein